MSETRVMAKDGKSPAGAKGGAGGADAEAAGGGKKKKVLLLGVAALLLAGGGGGWFVLFGPGASAEAAEPEPEPEVELGEVLTVPPISINLADGHYLKLGLGLQTTAEVEEELDGSRALDAAITLYSGRPMAEVADPATRDALKEELAHTIEEAYHEEVVEVFFTDYVTQ